MMTGRTCVTSRCRPTPILATRHRATQTLIGASNHVFRQIVQTFHHSPPGCARAGVLLQVLILSAGLVFAAATRAQINLPDIGDSSQSALSSSAEQALGDQIMRQVRSNLPIMDDPQISQYIQSLGYQLVSASDEQYLGFNFFVVEEPGVNAFALPGGYVGVNAGLILTADSESELASVIAHEIAHVTQRHIARFVERNANSGLKALAGILAAIAVGMVNSEAGKATAAVAMASQTQNRLDFSRSNEKEADRIGMQLLDKAAFDPEAMASFFEKLQGSARYYRRPPEFLSTHPVTTSRIAEARDRAQQLGYRQHVDSVEFKLTQARVRVLIAGTNFDVLDYFNSSVDRTGKPADIGSRYGLALAQARNDMYPQALDSMRKLAEDYPENITLSMSLAEIYAQSGNLRAALVIYEENYGLYPDNQLVIVNFTRALLQQGNSERVLKILTEYKRLLTLNPPLLRIMAEALEAEGRSAESQATLAEFLYSRGDLYGAVEQLTLASRHKDNSFYQASRIEARLEILKKEIAEHSEQH